MTNRWSRALLVSAVASFALTLSAGAALASSKQAKPEGAPRFDQQGVTSSIAPTSSGVDSQQGYQDPAFQTFSFNFTDPTNSTTYPITMIGTDPLKRDRSSSVNTLIIPLKMKFTAGGQDTSSLNDLGYVGFRAPALN